MTDNKNTENMKKEVREIEEKSAVCRDFLRNLCRRGDKCKFKHPNDTKEQYSFCHDFQNGNCFRPGCKFIHCSSEDEEYYRLHGKLLPHVYEKYKKIINSLRDSKVDENENQEKSRKRDVRNERLSDFKKRKHYDLSIEFEDRQDSVDGYAMWMLENENEMLRKRLQEVKKRYDDLQATNEFLLEQNARLRIVDKPTASLTTVTVPAVTITNTGALQPQTQVNMSQPQISMTTQSIGMAAVPVSIAAVATPVSFSTVSVAPVKMPSVSQNDQSAQQDVGLSDGQFNYEPKIISYPVTNTSIISGAYTHAH